MNRSLTFLAAVTMSSVEVTFLYSQGVGINATGLPADTSAMLDVNSTSKGFLPPRMTSAQRTAIALPATGLVVYQTDGTPGFFYNAGTSASPNWRRLLDSTSVTGSQWTTSGSNIYYGTGNVGIHANPTITDGVLDVAGRMRIRSGGDLFHSAGLWLNNVANSSLSAFVGMESDTTIGLYGNTGVGWGFGMNTSTGNVSILGKLGLGTNTPTAPLTFAPSLGKKITLYPGETGDVGFAVQGNLFQMYSDSPSADIAFGYDQAGSMTELMRIKASGNVGIGTASPNAPLSFPPTLTHKITLYPGATGDAGLGMAANRLQIYADNPNADVAIGYDAAGTFNERFAVKPNAAIAVNGNSGAAGQVLQSNGAGSAATWVAPTNSLYNNTNSFVSTDVVLVHDNYSRVVIPGMTSIFTLTSAAKVWVSFTVRVATVGCDFCGSTSAYLEIMVDGYVVGTYVNDVGNGATLNPAASRIFTMGPGNHTISIAAEKYGNDTNFAWTSDAPSTLDIQIIPQ